MVNIALLVITGITILNSASIILLAVNSRKKNKEIKILWETMLELRKQWHEEKAHTEESAWVEEFIDQYMANAAKENHQ